MISELLNLGSIAQETHQHHFCPKKGDVALGRIFRTLYCKIVGIDYITPQLNMQLYDTF